MEKYATQTHLSIKKTVKVIDKPSTLYFFKPFMKIVWLK